MKKTIKIFVLGLLSAALFSCQDAKLPTIDNMVYISDASNGRITSTLMGEESTEVLFSVRLAQAADKDIRVKISMDPSVLEKYNETYGTGFRHVAAENIDVQPLVVIPAGSVSSDPIKITIGSFETMGAQYAIAIKVTSNGDVPAAEESSRLIIQLVKPLKQFVPKLSKANGSQVAPKNEDWGYDLMNYTLEWWCKMIPKSGTNAFTQNNQAIINSGSGTRGCELYIRFGDLMFGSYYFNYLQVKTLGDGGNLNTGDPREGKGLNSNQWYHFAVTYDGNTGESTLYQDGVPVSTVNTGAGRVMCIDRFELVTGGMFVNYAEICQIRLWKTTRTADQIAKNMRSEVDYASKDLIMYLPMNEGEGATVFHDVTENGHDAAIGNFGGTDQAHAWNEYAF